MKSKIFALVHDSILAEVPEDEIDFYCEHLQQFVQMDRGITLQELLLVVILRLVKITQWVNSANFMAITYRDIQISNFSCLCFAFWELVWAGRIIVFG